MKDRDAMLKRVTLPCLLLALLAGGAASAANRNKALPKEDVVEFPPSPRACA